MAASTTLGVLLMILDMTTGPRWTRLPATAVTISDAACNYAFGQEPRVCTSQQTPVWTSDGQRVEACRADVVAYASDRGGWVCDAPPQWGLGIFGVTAYVVAFAGWTACTVLSCRENRENDARIMASFQTV